MQTVMMGLKAVGTTIDPDVVSAFLLLFWGFLSILLIKRGGKNNGN
jgi:hypothetical protein